MNAELPSAGAVLALDVGGTTVDAGIVLMDGSLAGDIRRVASPSDGDAATIVGCLSDVLATVGRTAHASGLDPVAVGVAMPGPFDYERGVSLMRHKLPAIRGVDLKGPLERVMRLPVSFCNDADAFALGAWWRKHPDQRRLVGITIGTGLGAGFVVDGRPVGEEQGTPPGAEVWNAPWRNGLLEDFVSGGAVERSYAGRGGEPIGADAVAARARSGDADAEAAFVELGTTLGEGLARALADFHPTFVVCGGQVAKAFDLFGPQAETVYAHATGSDVPFRAETDADLSVVGVARHAVTRVR